MAFSTKALAILTFASAIGFGALVVLTEMYLSAGNGLLDGRLNGYDGSAVFKYLELFITNTISIQIGRRLHCNQRQNL